MILLDVERPWGGGGGQGCRGKASRFVYNSYSTYLVFNFINILQWEALTSREILRFIQFHVKTNTQRRVFFLADIQVIYNC